MSTSDDTSAHTPQVVFACVRNGGRSVISRVLTEHYAGGRVTALSAGTQPGDHIHAEVAEVLEKLGLDTSAEHPKLLTRDTIMIASGLPGRLRPLPRCLLALEALAAAAAVAAGVRPWLQLQPRPLGVADRTATALTTTTFAIHTLRQAIYLSPGQGRQ